jgi:rod shape-determining protein MreD
MSILVEVFLYLGTGAAYWWWTQNFTVYGLAPNLIFAAALCAGHHARPGKANPGGFLQGLYADMLGVSAFGAYALTYSLMAYVVYVVKRQFDMDSFFSQLVAAVSLSWISMLFYMGLSLVFARFNPTGLKIFLAEPFLNALAVPVVFQLFYQAKRRTGAL